MAEHGDGTRAPDVSPDFSGKTAVVTGAASGIGRATAKALADAGATVTLLDVSDELGARAAEAAGGTYVHLDVSQPDAWREFAAALARHDPIGAAMTMRGVQATRPSLYALTEELRAVRTPVLIVAGDEDEGSLEPSLMLKRTIPTAGLLVLPKTGHTINLEEPEAFNRALTEFSDAVEADRWRPRDPRAVSGSITGVKTS